MHLHAKAVEGSSSEKPVHFSANPHNVSDSLPPWSQIAVCYLNNQHPTRLHMPIKFSKLAALQSFFHVLQDNAAVDESKGVIGKHLQLIALVEQKPAFLIGCMKPGRQFDHGWRNVD